MTETTNLPGQTGEPAGAATGDTNRQDFSRQAEEAQPGLFYEFLEFLRYNKAWWLTPIILVLLLVGLLLVLSSTAAAPFIYTIF